MSDDSFRPHTFIPLFPSPHDRDAADELRQAVDPLRERMVRVVTMPVAGLAFFQARGDTGRRLNEAWFQAVPRGGRPVVLLRHEAGLADYVAGLDAEFVIGCDDSGQTDDYLGLANVEVVASGDPLTIAQSTIRAWSQGPDSCFRSGGQGLPARDWWDDGIAPPVDPLSMLAEAPLPPGESPLSRHQMLVPSQRPTTHGKAPGRAGWMAWAGGLLHRPRPIDVPSRVGDLLLGSRPAPLVVVGSRKGGVGKTALSAGLAQVFGYSLDGRAGVAALVDQNINNADQWGRLMLPGGVLTVREIMSALEDGQELPPPPAFARTPALAVYPESRDPGDGYPVGLIERLVENLRGRHVVTVIDLPNAMPAFTSAEASVAASYIGCADLVIVPTTDDPNSLRGALDYLRAPSLRLKRCLVTYIVSPERGIREDPVVIDLLDQLRDQCAALIAFPKTEKATLAVVKGTSILHVETRLRNAFIELAVAVAKLLAVRRS